MLTVLCIIWDETHAKVVKHVQTSAFAASLTVTKALAFLLWKPIDHHGHDLSLDVLEAILQLDWTTILLKPVSPGI